MDADTPTSEGEVVSRKTVATVKEGASPISVFHLFGERWSPAPGQHVMAAAERLWGSYDSGAGIVSPVHADELASSGGGMLEQRTDRKARKAAKAAKLEVKLLEERQSLLVDLEGLARCLQEKARSRQCALESLETVRPLSHFPAATHVLCCTSVLVPTSACFARSECDRERPASPG